METRTFDKFFTKLPTELRDQIWSYAIHIVNPRILQTIFDPETLSWQICKDSIKPDPVSQVSADARKLHIIFLGIAIIPRRDIILVSDPRFDLRIPQIAFLELHNLQCLQHISFTVDLWQNMRHTHHEFPHHTLSPATILRKLPALTDFYLAVSEDDQYELETGSYGYEGEWEPGWEDEEDEDEDEDHDDNRQSDSDGEVQNPEDEETLPSGDMLAGLPTLPPLGRDANGELTRAGKTDRFLRGLEDGAFEHLDQKQCGRSHGILQLAKIAAYSSFDHESWDDNTRDPAEKLHYRNDICIVFGRETLAVPDWKAPTIHVRELKTGHMMDIHDYDTDEEEFYSHVKWLKDEDVETSEEEPFSESEEEELGEELDE